MAAERFIAPNAISQWFDAEGRPTQAALRYLVGIEKLSGRVSANVADLPTAGSSTTAELETKINAILAALQAAEQMEV